MHAYNLTWYDNDSPLAGKAIYRVVKLGTGTNYLGYGEVANLFVCVLINMMNKCFMDIALLNNIPGSSWDIYSLYPEWCCKKYSCKSFE